jgi:hypothetical protein
MLDHALANVGADLDSITPSFSVSLDTAHTTAVPGVFSV